MRRIARLPVIAGALLLIVALAPIGAGAKAPDFTSIVKQNRDAVVNISTTQKVDENASGVPPELLKQLPDGHPLKRFFKRFGGGGNGSPSRRENTSLGSGFIISADGYILTNAHVVAKADEIVVKLRNNQQYDARVVGMDKPTDIGLLKIDAKGLPTVDIGNSDELEVGEWLLAIGSPFGLEYTATQGIVSAVDRSLPNDTYTPFIQTDVAVNPGNSGGPLFNGDGEVVGINSQIFSRSGGYMGLSFAVPINTAMDIVEQLKSTGSVERGYLGVSIQPVNRGLAKSFGLDKPVGALVAEVVPDSPAEKAGLKPGDVILGFDGREVTDAADLPPMVGQIAAGETVELQILRDGEKRTLSARIEPRSSYEEQSSDGAQSSDGKTSELNVVVREMTQAERKKLGLGERGLLVENVGPGPVAKAGIRSGDILLGMDGQSLSSIDQLRQAVKAAPRGEPIHMRVRREDRTLFVSLTIPQK